MRKNSTLRPKLHLLMPKTAARAVNSMKTMLQAAKSGYCTSVASEMGTSSPKIVLESKSRPKIGPKGPEGDKKVRTKFHSEAETACGLSKK